ncbi:MAG: DNA-protecting protein DprA [Treponema sp.]|uniref:DNA-processing protein DprA n=1 Tax=Treponema sp. TaxID=166 RepID=UPI00298E7787|nr:DNA-processing protein DprA [Treponema sp.]MBR5934166.1 DNA-protecting protein DprA [Treponema sp.]
MTKADKDYETVVLSLSRLSFLTLGEKLNLLKKLDSLCDLVVLSIEDISKIIGRKSKTTLKVKTAVKEAQRDALVLKKLGISWVLILDREYPDLLREISDPPFILFYRGDIGILSKKCVSVVGTRKITGEACKAAVQFSKDACLDGTNVISGLAFGVDKKAHEGSLEAYYEALDKEAVGKTVAVLPGGIDAIIPGSHKRLAAKILESGGLLLSEYPPVTDAKPYCFVERNRIIAGLSLSTVVIQAPVGSGAMITADFAAGYNREVMFHKAAFCESSRRINAFVKNQLVYQAKKNKGGLNKLKKDPELFVNDGAPVIENYADYLKCLVEDPAERICRKNKEVQLELFDSTNSDELEEGFYG